MFLSLECIRNTNATDIEQKYSMRIESEPETLIIWIKNLSFFALPYTSIKGIRKHTFLQAKLSEKFFFPKEDK